MCVSLYIHKRLWQETKNPSTGYSQRGEGAWRRGQAFVFLFVFLTIKILIRERERITNRQVREMSPLSTEVEDRFRVTRDSLRF